MRKITIITAAIATSLALATAANAATPGAYAGLGLGASTLRTPNQNLWPAAPGVTSSRDTGGLGGRIFGGYNFNNNFGLEAALATYANSKYKSSFGNSSQSAKYSLDALSVVAKGYLPFAEGFNAYVLGGLAEVRSELHIDNVNLPPQMVVNSKTTNRIRPVYGVGVSYDVNQHITTNVELSRIQGSGNVKTSTSAIPNADMLSLNLGYNFG